MTETASEPTLEEYAEMLRVAIEESDPDDFISLDDFIAAQMKDPAFRFWWYFHKVRDWPVEMWYKLIGRWRQ